MFFFNDTATTEIYTLSLHDALPILQVALEEAERLSASAGRDVALGRQAHRVGALVQRDEAEAEQLVEDRARTEVGADARSEEHTSELQSRQYLVCRLLLEKKKHITH